VNVLGLIEEYRTDLEAIGSGPPPAPRWNQDWFPRLDAAAAYAMVRKTKPRRIVEVGSGHSTRFMARAVADGGLDTRITAIDPRPRADFASLNVEHLAIPVQQAGRAPFVSLEKDDILFIDSSHQLKPGSDVEFLFKEVLPKLAAGIHIHFHDIFLPDDYPAQWSWRRYNEQEAVRLLLKDGAFETQLSSHAIVSRHPEKIRGVLERLPLVPGAIESSLWLTKR